jgi:hypothetical protein
MSATASATLHDGDLAAEAAEHLAELEPDVAAAQHQQVRGQLIQLHDRAGIEARRVLEAGDVQPRGARARVDADDLAAHQPHLASRAADLERARADEPRFAADERDARRLEPALAARAEPLDDLLLAQSHVREVHRDRAGTHAVVGRAAREVCDAGARDHGLGGRAPDVDAGPADVRALDQRGSPAGTGERGGERAARLSRPDDDGVEPLRIHGSVRLE